MQATPEERAAEIKELIAKGEKEYQEFREKQIEEEAVEILKKEWRASFFSRNTSLPEDEYIEENMEQGKKMALRIIKLMSGEKVGNDDEEEHWMDKEEEEEVDELAKAEASSPKVEAGVGAGEGGEGSE
ncbi:hypothetical protein TeGR_g3878 [Tetraparma gracilis]|uniref:Uncharacterized protein n=1 Tax=Tetraparma gracilis TaxID=2962635 RepID=A0ABQ6MFT3_9STRA|nr:hypothetical protein TeGR_g3878 [Tetraparma gracilis]